jgi:hypothetical protein
MLYLYWHGDDLGMKFVRIKRYIVLDIPILIEINRKLVEITRIPTIIILDVFG